MENAEVKHGTKEGQTPAESPTTRRRRLGLAQGVGSPAAPPFMPGQQYSPFTAPTLSITPRTPTHALEDQTAISHLGELDDVPEVSGYGPASPFGTESGTTSVATQETPSTQLRSVRRNPFSPDDLTTTSISGQSSVVSPQDPMTSAHNRRASVYYGPSGPLHAGYPHASRVWGTAGKEWDQTMNVRDDEGTPSLDYLHRHRQGFSETFRPSHTNSRTWTNPRAEEQERWAEVEGNLRHMELIPRSPIVPHNFEQWLDYRVNRLEDKKRDEGKKARRHHGNRDPGMKTAFDGKTFKDGRGAVLSQQTIWHEPLEASGMRRPLAEWPSREEMKEEGDERNTSRFGRFLGLPRYAGNATVNWKVRSQIEATAMDDVWKLPTKRSIEESREKWPVTETETVENHLGKGLIEGLECNSDSDD